MIVAGAVRLRARWLVTLTGPPVMDGAVLVGDDGRVVACGPAAAVPRPDGVPAEDLGEGVLLPGLVNAHTHLELTVLRGLVRVRPFSAWVHAVRGIKDGLDTADFLASSRAGALECLASGITTVGDTGSTLTPARAMAELGLRGTAYHEVFGPDPAQVQASLAGADAALTGLASWASERVRIGLSPHAPYTVSEPLLVALCARAASEGRPLAMHLAESAEETRMVRDGMGAFAERLGARGIPVSARGVSPVRWAVGCGVGRGAPALCIHVVHADAEDRSLLAAQQASVAHCPWSNDLLGNGRADLDALRAAGLKVGIGTDSVAAGNAVDLFAEVRFATATAPLSPRAMLRLITADGAAALGIADAGEIRPGAWGDLTVLALHDRVPLGRAADVESAVARTASAADVLGTWVAGVPRYRAGRWPGVDTEAARMAYDAAHRRARTAAATIIDGN